MDIHGVYPRQFAGDINPDPVQEKTAPAPHETNDNVQPAKETPDPQKGNLVDERV